MMHALSMTVSLTVLNTIKLLTELACRVTPLGTA